MPSFTRAVYFVFAGACLAVRLSAQPFYLPTANTAVVQPGAEDRAFAATAPDKGWISGTFGCVRDNGWRFHKGLDIRSIQHDRYDEPTDPVMSTADGVVMYVNTRPSLSNYGNYIVIQHHIEGLEVYSLYAHLSRIAPGIQAGVPVKTGQVIAIMGRTSNAERIGKERAHVHFELNLFNNEHFDAWFHQTSPNERNDHGMWNGRNLIGFDPRLVLLQERQRGAQFSLIQFLRSRTELCRVFVRVRDFPFLHRYPQFITPNPVAQKEGVAGYELVLDFDALPFEIIPRAASEMKGSGKFQLLSVNDTEEEKNPARRLVTKRSGRWALDPHGIDELSLLTAN